MLDVHTYRQLDLAYQHHTIFTDHLPVEKEAQMLFMAMSELNKSLISDKKTAKTKAFEIAAIATSMAEKINWTQGGPKNAS